MLLSSIKQLSAMSYLPVSEAQIMPDFMYLGHWKGGILVGKVRVRPVDITPCRAFIPIKATGHDEHDICFGNASIFNCLPGFICNRIVRHTTNILARLHGDDTFLDSWSFGWCDVELATRTILVDLFLFGRISAGMNS